MAYPNQAIQVVFDRYQSRGLPGQIAKVDNNTWYFDVATAGVDLLPGQAVYLDTGPNPTQGDWILPPSTSEEGDVTHIVSYEVTNLNVAIAAPTTNALSEITYPATTIGVKAFAAGSMYVQAGATILAGDALQWDFATSTYIPYALASTKLLIVALTNAVADDIFPVRIARIA